ncbi:MAG: hypothetical protein KatS3mg083_467 [Candidatus Dojkabacteria bacterium]|nr:MAG: hypothetical protein KatS3mg083_467 [Candidatus Dojkabacteria bacterium]
MYGFLFGQQIRDISGEKIRAMRKKLYDYVGREVMVSVGVNGLEIISFRVLIVGYIDSIQPFTVLRYDFELGRGSSFEPVGVVIPEWALSINSEIGRLFSESKEQDTVYIIEFDSAEKRFIFERDLRIYRPISSFRDYFEGQLNWTLYLLVCIAFMLLIIAIFFLNINLLKITASSKKEIAVFRALGSKEIDIV